MVTDVDICAEMELLIVESIPGSRVKVSGSAGHFRVAVWSEVFRGKSTLAQHRIVYKAIAPLMSGATPPVHAIDYLETNDLVTA